jgi:hypothetical protein
MGETLMLNAQSFCFLSAFALTSLTLGCGKKSSVTDALGGFLQDPTGDIATDVYALAENQSDLMDDLASAINETGSGGSSASLALANDATVSGNKSRTCVENSPENGKVTVTVSYIAGKKDTSERKGRLGANAASVNAEVSGEGTLTRVWTPVNPTDAKCTSKNHFKFKDDGKTGSALKDLQMTATESRTRTMSVTKSGKKLTGRKMQANGTRTVVFKETTETGYTYEKEVDSSVSRTITMDKPDGSTVERVKTITTPSKLIVRVKRSSIGELESKVITAGKVESSLSAEDIKVTTEFDSLTYNFTSSNDNTCTPVSGKLTGETYKAGVQVKAYVIDYGAADTDKFPSGISIALDGSDAIDCPTCVVAKCDFE